MKMRYFNMDKELENICFEIYRKHKKAFDLIYEVVEDSVSQFSNYIKEWLSSHSETYQIHFDPKYSSKAYIRFTTPFIDELFPYDEEKNDVWKFGFNFMYEIEIVKDGINLIGILANSKHRLSKPLLNFIKANSNEFKYTKRILSKKELLNKEEAEEGLTDDIIEILNKSLAKRMKEDIPKFEKKLKEYLQANGYINE